MRVLRVITRMDVHGGAELSTLLEVEQLAARGHELVVVTVAEPTTDAAALRLEHAGVTHQHLAGGGARRAASLRRLVRTWRPHVVHSVIWGAEVAAGAATVGLDVATVVSLVNMQYAPEAVAVAPSPRRLEVLRRLEGLLVRHRYDHVHCLTRAGAAHSVDHLGVDPARITVIPRGRPLGDFEVDPLEVARCRQELLDGRSTLVVQVGRHEAQKGQDLLIEAVALLGGAASDLRVVVAGREGNATAALRELIERSGLTDTVQLLGARRDVPTLLAAADVAAVTSRWEGLGGAVVETLGAGAPVVAFAVPAVAEVLGDAAVLVDPFDVAGLAEQLGALAGDQHRRGELSRRARDRFEQRFELGAVVDRIEQMYADLVGAAVGSTR